MTKYGAIAASIIFSMLILCLSVALDVFIVQRTQITKEAFARGYEQVATTHQVSGDKVWVKKGEGK